MSKTLLRYSAYVLPMAALATYIFVFGEFRNLQGWYAGQGCKIDAGCTLTNLDVFWWILWGGVAIAPLILIGAARFRAGTGLACIIVLWNLMSWIGMTR